MFLVVAPEKPNSIARLLSSIPGPLSELSAGNGPATTGAEFPRDRTSAWPGRKGCAENCPGRTVQHAGAPPGKPLCRAASAAGAICAICYILFPDPWPKRYHHPRRLSGGINYRAPSRASAGGRVAGENRRSSVFQWMEKIWTRSGYERRVEEERLAEHISSSNSSRKVCRFISPDCERLTIEKTAHDKIAPVHLDADRAGLFLERTAIPRALISLSHATWRSGDRRKPGAGEKWTCGASRARRIRRAGKFYDVLAVNEKIHVQIRFMFSNDRSVKNPLSEVNSVRTESVVEERSNALSSADAAAHPAGG